VLNNIFYRDPVKRTVVNVSRGGVSGLVMDYNLTRLDFHLTN